MSDSAIALGIFGSDKAALATDLSAGVHTLKVTTNAASDGIVVDGFGAAKYVIGTVRTSGVHTLCATTNASNAAIALHGAGGEKVVLGTVQSGGVHTIAVTTGAANSSVLIDGFGSGLVRLATVLAAGVHSLAVTAAPDNGFAISSFATGESVIAAAKSGGVYSLALSGLMDPEAAAYFAAAGITNAAAKGLINDFYGAVKTYFAVTALSDVFDQIILARNQNAAAVVVDLCGRVNATLVNNPGVTPWRYIENADGLSYIDLNIIPPSGIRFTNANHSFGFFQVTPISGTANNMYGAINNSFQGYQFFTGNNNGNAYYCDSNAISIGEFTEHTPQAGFHVTSRLGAASWSGYCDGAKMGTSTGASNVAISWSLFGLGRNRQGTLDTAYVLPVREAFFFTGRGMTDAEVAVFSGHVNTLLGGLAAL